MPKYIRNKDLTSLNTFGMKVKAALYIEFSQASELESLDWDSLPGPLLFLGGGSNILFTGDFAGTVLRSRINGIKAVEELCSGDDIFVRAGSGELMDEFCRKTAIREWWGAENLSGIPGTVGAAPVQNVGAYGVEAADIVESVDCYDVRERRFLSFSKHDCRFGYRDSLFKQEKGRYIILSVLFHLHSDFRPQLSYAHLQEEVERNAEIAFSTADPYNPILAEKAGPHMPLTPMLVRDTVKIMRESKLPDPARTGSAGSFFKNPVLTAEEYERVEAVVKAERGTSFQLPSYRLEDGKVKLPAAFLIDFCGFKGLRCGGAAVWERQPLVLVNRSGKATASDVLALERRIREGVSSRLGVELTAEVEHI